MPRAIRPLIACAIMAACVGCSKPDPVDSRANAAGLPADPEAGPDATGSPPANAISSTGGQAPAASTIPAALQGRWGLAPMDCTSRRGDAKGLLVIGPADVKFYESRAVPGPDTQVGKDSITGDFAFTGEGQTWTKFETLELKGQELVRTEGNPMASFTYARCK